MNSMAFKGWFPVKCKLVVIDQLIEQVYSCRFLGCDLPYVGEIDVDTKKEKLNHMCGTIRMERSVEILFGNFISHAAFMAVRLGH